MVVRFTKARPTTGEMPLDSLMAQMICWSLRPPCVVDVAVLGLPLFGRPVLVLVLAVFGRVVALPFSSRYVGYEVEAGEYEVDGRRLPAILLPMLAERIFTVRRRATI